MSEMTPAEKATAVFKQELMEMQIYFHDDLLDAIIKHLGSSVHDADGSLVACSDPKELATIKTNFLKGKLGIEDEELMDKALHEACHGLGESNRKKHRPSFYYLLVAILHKESVFIDHN